jgi:phospho-N-acetylmuramoyl-pentapeptide-transferase
MIYYIFEFLENNYNLPGAGVFQYISFRSALAIMTSLLVSLVFGGKIIRFIKKMQIGEDVRKLGLDGEEKRHSNYGWTHHFISDFDSNNFIC